MTELNTPVEQGESGKIGAQIKTAPAVRQHCGSGASPISNFSGSDRLMAEATKTCTRCGARRPLTDFAKSPVGAGGLRAVLGDTPAKLQTAYRYVTGKESTDG